MGLVVTNEDRSLLEALSEHVPAKGTWPRRISIVVSFTRESGVYAISDLLKQAADNGCRIRLLTSKYLGITEPSALYLLKRLLGDSLDLRLYKHENRSFHPKAYIFEYPDGNDDVVFVGSSNLTHGGLVTGVEWNYAVARVSNPADVEAFKKSFNTLWRKHSELATDTRLREYARAWRRPKIIDLDAYTDARGVPRPRHAQNEALYELTQTREEGFDKALVVAATGVGKTYLAAFDSVGFRRVLFVAHREEIIRQAMRSFTNVRPQDTLGLFCGEDKDGDANLVFATIQTLGQERYLTPDFFAPDHFDCIIVDEFHHAAAKSYRKLLDYFRPKFLLGLTATPDRMDNRDIYALCDYNVAYEISLAAAITRGLLVPFRYYGIYDDSVDYDDIDFAGGRYDLEQLEGALSRTGRADLVLEHYRRYYRRRTLAFCASIKHAEYMAEYFTNQGVKAVSVTSGSGSGCPCAMDRGEAISRLEAGEIEVVFSVDVFNEGVDIPSIEMVLFLRPTESYTVFLQQLGRGLRHHPGKEHLTVLDFIGNYRRADYKPYFLSGQVGYEQSPAEQPTPKEGDYPEGCLVNFDFRLIKLFETQRRTAPIKLQLLGDYREVQNKLQHRPTRMDIYQQADFPLRLYLSKYGGWLRFLEVAGDLDEEERGWLDTLAEEFLREMEKTSMTKSYKIPVLRALVNQAEQQGLFEVGLEVIGEEFEVYYRDHQVHLQDFSNKRHRGWEKWDTSKYTQLARENPVNFLSRSSYFSYDDEEQLFSVTREVWPYISQRFLEHCRDILRFRETDYFRRRFD